MTTEGWKAIDVLAAKQENPELEITTLQIGDLLIIYDDSTEEITSLTEQKTAPLSTKVYNFHTDGNNTYYANGYLVHNATGSDTESYQDYSDEKEWVQDV
jgi:intein/homing endonuclease